jgi:hypothetical protein
MKTFPVGFDWLQAMIVFGFLRESGCDDGVVESKIRGAQRNVNRLGAC